MTTLFIARHGNTFLSGEVPLRVGARTDLPLVESGIVQARALGSYFKQEQINPAAVYSGHLKRAHETARLALESLGNATPIIALDMLNEIDYGPDEAKTEDEVIARIGKEAIDAWDKDAIVPKGWKVNPQAIIDQWKGFAKTITGKHRGETVLVVTSNGIARFVPHITGDFSQFSAQHSLKVSTGALCCFKHSRGRWHIEYWNKKVS